MDSYLDLREETGAHNLVLKGSKHVHNQPCTPAQVSREAGFSRDTLGGERQLLELVTSGQELPDR